MWSTLLLSLRESLEASLVIGITLAQLMKTQQIKLVRYVVGGTILGIVISLLGGTAGFIWAKHLNEEITGVFEASIKIIAAGLIAYFIVWLGNQNTNFSTDIGNKISSNNSAVGLFLLSFLSVFREGLELIVFILTKITEKANDVALGSGIGIMLAVLIAFLIFKTAVKLNLKLIFKFLGLVLIYFGADMFGEGFADLLGIHSGQIELVLKFAYALPALIFFVKDFLPRRN